MSRNAGRVQAYDGPIYIADAALYMGVEQPYALTKSNTRMPSNLLRAQRELVGRYWHDAFIQIEDFTNEGVAASSSWPFQVNILQGGRSADCQRGSPGRSDRLGGHDSDARQRTQSQLRIQVAQPLDHTEAAGRSGRLVWDGPGGPGGLRGQRTSRVPTAVPPTDLTTFDQIKFWQTPTEDCLGAGGTCVPYYRWVTDYLAVIGGR